MKDKLKSESRMHFSSIRKHEHSNFEKVSDPLTLESFILSLECRMSHHVHTQNRHTTLTEMMR